MTRKCTNCPFVSDHLRLLDAARAAKSLFADHGLDLERYEEAIFHGSRIATPAEADLIGALRAELGLLLDADCGRVDLRDLAYEALAYANNLQRVSLTAGNQTHGGDGGKPAEAKKRRR